MMFEKVQVDSRVRRRKAGFGITEILISAAVLGFLLVALNYLQSSNRDSVLRVRARDGAVAVAQEVIDELSAKGVASLQATRSADGAAEPLVLEKSRQWKGTPGSLEHTMTVNYTVRVNISEDSEYQNTEQSNYVAANPIHHVYAKRLDVEVEWSHKGTPFSINVSSIVR